MVSRCRAVGWFVIMLIGAAVAAASVCAFLSPLEDEMRERSQGRDGLAGVQPDVCVVVWLMSFGGFGGLWAGWYRRVRHT